MKFELFGRLRDNEEENGSNSNDMNSDFGNGQDQMSMGDGLDRTVESMFNQGYSEEDIKQELSGQYDEAEIQDAINSAVTSSAQGNSNTGPEPMSPYQSNEDGAVSPMDEGFNNDQSQGRSMDQQQNNGGQPEPQSQQPIEQPGQQQQQNDRPRGSIDPQTEELIETIIAEKIDQIFSEFDNVYTEIDDIRDEMDEMEQRLHDLEVRDDEDQQQFIQKVEEMEDHVDQYQSRIGGLEKAFQQVLPSLVDNVQDVTQLVQEIKDERDIETTSDVDTEKIENMDMEDWN